jgi:hypothetical protein
MSWRLEDEGNPSQQKRRRAELLAHQHLHVSLPSARAAAVRRTVLEDRTQSIFRARANYLALISQASSRKMRQSSPAFEGGTGSDVHR